MPEQGCPQSSLLIFSAPRSQAGHSYRVVIFTTRKWHTGLKRWFCRLKYLPKHEDCISCPQNSPKLIGVVVCLGFEWVGSRARLFWIKLSSQSSCHGYGRGRFINDSFLTRRVEREWGRYPMSVVPRDGDGGWKEQNWEGEDHSSHLKGSKR